MKRILTALLLLMLATPAWGQNFEKGLQAYGRGDYATAIRIWRPLAEQGNAEAQFRIGDILSIGRNYKEALPWYLRSAKQGNTKAQHSLAMIYGGAEGVPQNFAQANQWLMEAADHGLALAQYDLGLVYSKGRGVPKNSINRDFPDGSSQAPKTVAQSSIGRKRGRLSRFVGLGWPRTLREFALIA